MPRAPLLPLSAGPLAALAAAWLLPLVGVDGDAARVGAVAALMAAWWVSEALPLGVVALTPLVAFPVLGIMDAETVSRRYGDPIIFLFLGGFMLGMALQKSGLHRRLALAVVAAFGEGPPRLLAGFMAASAVLSMWITNTAAAVMLVPIAAAVLQRLSEPDRRRIGPPLLLGIAYGCSIGGTATLVGSPPNMIFAGQMKRLFPDLPEITFAGWLALALPMALGFLLLAWGYLCLWGRLWSVPSAESAATEPAALGPMTTAEKVVGVVFAVTALGWIFRADIDVGVFRIPGWSTLAGLPGMHDATVAVAAALALFALPVKLRPLEFALDWEWGRRIPWEVLLLFGGGFALAEGFAASGLGAHIGRGLSLLKELPPPVIMLVVCLGATFLSEVFSNTAQATLLIPLLAAAAAPLGLHPYALLFAATIATSLAFMLPSGTPPNAVVFGTGLLSVRQMAKAGLALNILGSVWITLWVLLVQGWVGWR